MTLPDDAQIINWTQFSEKIQEYEEKKRGLAAAEYQNLNVEGSTKFFKFQISDDYKTVITLKLACINNLYLCYILVIMWPGSLWAGSTLS